MLDHIISAILIQSDIREPFDLSNLHRRPGSQKINNKNDIFGFVNTFFLEFRTCFCHKVDKIERKVINKDNLNNVYIRFFQFILKPLQTKIKLVYTSTKADANFK